MTKKDIEIVVTTDLVIKVKDLEGIAAKIELAAASIGFPARVQKISVKARLESQEEDIRYTLIGVYPQYRAELQAMLDKAIIGRAEVRFRSSPL